jgi:hypothetical protein
VTCTGTHLLISDDDQLAGTERLGPVNTTKAPSTHTCPTEDDFYRKPKERYKTTKTYQQKSNLTVQYLLKAKRKILCGVYHERTPIFIIARISAYKDKVEDGGGGVCYTVKKVSDGKIAYLFYSVGWDVCV